MTNPIVDVTFDEHHWYVEVTIVRLDGSTEVAVYAADYDGIVRYDSVEDWENGL